ncbi:MAG: ATP-grasp domain-containing protein [Rhizobacter sp.]
MTLRLAMIGGWTDIYRKAKDLGFDLTVVQRRQDVKPEDMQLIDQLVTASLPDKIVIGIVEALHKERPFDAVVSFQELGILNAALIADRLGIHGNPLKPVLLTRDKCQMRRHLQAAGIPSIPFIEVSDAQSVIDFGNACGWPIILKPANGVGSIQVHKIHAAHEVAAVYAEIMADPVFREVAGLDFPDPKLIAEKFIVGREVSVEAVTWAGVHSVVGVTDKLIIGGSNFVEAGHTMPSDLPADTLVQLEQMVETFLDSIGHLYGPSHTEIILSSEGPIIVESHTRTGGDRIFEMAEYVYGVDMIGETLKGFAGKFEGVTKARNGGAAIRYMQTLAGTVVALSGVAEAALLDGVVRADIGIKVGAKVGESRHSAERPGYVLAVGDTRQDAISNADRALRNIMVEVA